MKTRLVASTLLLAAALLPGAAPAQAPRTAAAAERNAVELKQGMTPEEVETLLGKPRRTALRVDSGYGGPAGAQGTLLQWTYVWSGGAGGSSHERTLQVDFSGKSAGQWSVNSWAWPSD
jgi:hypothetical protein